MLMPSPLNADDTGYNFCDISAWTFLEALIILVCEYTEKQQKINTISNEFSRSHLNDDLNLNVYNSPVNDCTMERFLFRIGRV